MEKSSRPIRALLKELASLSRTFDSTAARRRMAIVSGLKRSKITRPSDLKDYHDLLCFMVAHPDHRKLLALVESELRGFGKRIAHYKAVTRDRHAEKLHNSGIVDTTTTHLYSYELARLLLRHHAKDMSMDWEINEETVEAALPGILPPLVAWQENDALDYDEELGTIDWLEMTRRSKTGGYLKTLVDLLDNAPIPHLIRRHFYERMDIEATWQLRASKASRTLKRIPGGPTTFFQREPMIGRSQDLQNDLRKPAAPLMGLSRKEGEAWVLAVNEVLAVRNRELFPITLANPGEVYLYRPGRGLTIAIYGMNPEDRLPIETNFGALLVRNGLPIGYGVAAVLFDRVEIAINVFPAFRNGESAFIIEQFFRAFYRHFGSRVFLVRNTQMGYGEDEALYSGAFWFYNRLGFRALDPGVKALAEKERAKQKANSRYRTPIGTMRKLSVSDVVMHTDPNRAQNWQDPSIINLGYAVTKYFAKNFDGDRQRGMLETISSVRKTLHIGSIATWSLDEIAAFERLAPLVAMIHDLKKWRPAEKRDLVAIIRAKGGPKERKFVLLVNQHEKFRQAVSRLAAQAPL